MFEGNGFGKTLGILHKTMDVSTLRREVISNNISNSDTPNYKRSEVNFEAEMARVLRNEDKKVRPEAAMSDPRHISFNHSKSYKDVHPSIHLDHLTTTKNNGNNVDIEVEMMNALENQMRYQLLSQMVAGKFNKINMVVR